MKPSAIFSGCCLMLTTLFSVAQADDALTYRSQPLNASNTAHVIVRAAEHPELAVDRAVSSQPVHPWMAEVQLGTLSTYVDPAQDLSNLDENHALRRAQTYYNQMTGVTTEELAAMKNTAAALINRIPQGNRAQVVAMPIARPGPEVRNIRIIFPAPNQNMPSVPKQQPRNIEQVAAK
jgi:hypothetical protein